MSDSCSNAVMIDAAKVHEAHTGNHAGDDQLMVDQYGLGISPAANGSVARFETCARKRHTRPSSIVQPVVSFVWTYGRDGCQYVESLGREPALRWL